MFSRFSGFFPRLFICSILSPWNQNKLFSSFNENKKVRRSSSSSHHRPIIGKSPPSQPQSSTPSSSSLSPVYEVLINEEDKDLPKKLFQVSRLILLSGFARREDSVWFQHWKMRRLFNFFYYKKVEKSNANCQFDWNLSKKSQKFQHQKIVKF